MMAKVFYDDPDMYYTILEEICSNYPSDETLNLIGGNEYENEIWKCKNK